MNYRRLLIAIDNGPTAEAVAEKGFELGRQLNAEMALVSVVDTTFLITDGAVSPREMTELLKDDFRHNEKLLAEKIFKDYKVWTFVEAGKPYDTILKVAAEWKADLIVMGTHGRKGLSHLFMGSVAEQVVRHSAIPVLIFPGSTPE